MSKHYHVLAGMGGGMNRHAIYPDALLEPSAVYEAAHTLFSLAYADEWEERGGVISRRTVLTSWVPKQSAEVYLPIMWYLIGRVEQAWGMPIGLVFYHAGIHSTKDQEHALSDLMLGCHGHGVSLGDDFSEAIGQAESILRRTFAISPFSDEGNYWRELAWSLIESKPVCASMSCGQPFTPTRPDRRYCSESCRQAQVQREYRKNKKAREVNA